MSRTTQSAHGSALPPPVSPHVVAALGIDAEPLRIPPVELWPAEGQCFVGRTRVPLTRREFDLLVALAASAGHVVSRQRLYDLVWGQAMPRRHRDVDVYVRKLRLRLAAAAPGWTFIHTHRPFGYRFAPEQPDAK